MKDGDVFDVEALMRRSTTGLSPGRQYIRTQRTQSAQRNSTSFSAVSAVSAFPNGCRGPNAERRYAIPVLGHRRRHRRLAGADPRRDGGLLGSADRRSTPRFARRGRPGPSRIPTTGGAPARRRFAPCWPRAGVACRLDRGHRPLRPDARRRAARRARRRCCGPRLSGATSAPKRNAAGSNRDGRPRSAAAADVESGADQFHADQAALGPPPRARGLAPRRARAAAEGLRPLPAERRATRSMSPTRPARCCSMSHAARWSQRDARRGGHRPRGCFRRCSSRPEICARVSREAAALTGLRDGHADRRRRRRPGGGRGRHGHHAARRGQRDDWHLGCGLRRDRPSRHRSEGAAAHVLSRHARAVARDGRDAGRGPFAALAPRSDRWRCERRGHPTTS